MTRVVSLSDRAYALLRAMKGQGESFSDVVLRLVKREPGGSLLPLAGRWRGEDADEVLRRLMEDRKRAAPRRF